MNDKILASELMKISKSLKAYNSTKISVLLQIDLGSETVTNGMDATSVIQKNMDSFLHDVSFEINGDGKLKDVKGNPVGTWKVKVK